MRTILQTESAECGIACLAMIASHFGSDFELPDLRRRFSISLKGARLAQLIRHAAALNFSSRPIRLDLHELELLKCPAILHWNLNHFVVLKKVKRYRGGLVLTIVDPAIGERKIGLEEVSKGFTGVALELTPTPAFKKVDETKKISIRQLTGPVKGLRSSLTKIFLMSLALEIFAIVSPLFNQYVVDEVIVSGDLELLKILVIGFGLLLITQTAISLLRSWILMRWSLDVGMQWSVRVFSHLLRLPTIFFEKRHLGDVLSRFGSIDAIQQTLTSLFVESALDSLMAVFALVMMLIYSLKLSLVVGASLAAYGVLRWLFYSPLREASQERLILSAKEKSNFVETIRAIVPLKLFGREADRLSRWHNLRQDVVNRDVKTQKLGIIFKVLNTTISGIQGLIVFYIGSELVIQSQLSIGMLLAFISYSGTFGSRTFGLIDTYIGLKMLGLHAERLSDLVLEDAEVPSSTETDLSRIVPAITVRNLSFRYSEGEPWILDSVDLHIPAGQSIVLVGPSGCGKTTLCKILLGLLQPTSGEILIDNIPIRRIGLDTYRKLVGTVMQDDILLAGSLYDNISFFDSILDNERIETCARQAAIHDEICAMPMGYQSLIGEMGSMLSGGQKQRLLLARALYKSPKILALDEATSHLDLENEQKVNLSLQGMELTRIMVAHRPETINSAERVVAFRNAKLVELRSMHLEKNIDCNLITA